MENKKKWILITVIILVIVVIIIAVTALTKNGKKAGGKSDAAVNSVIDEFMKLAEIPRMSEHEEAVSDYLLNWAKEKGLDAEQDAFNNVIVKKPAAEEFSEVPLTILQGHMDMVCIAEPGKDYNPLTDPIKVINDGKTMKADGTSLGADDGIGVATILYILQSDLELGPVQAIFTVNEENGMTGVAKIHEKYVKDAAYLVNLDAEDSKSAIVSSAGDMTAKLKKEMLSTAPTLNTGMTIFLSGLSGGHSGLEINTGKVNAIRAVSDLLLAMDQAGIPFELSGLQGGVARNAIPAECTASIVINSADAQKVKDLCDHGLEQLKQAVATTEPNIKLTYEETDVPNAVLTEADKKNVISLLTLALNGVHTMSQDVEGLVQSSSNIGIAKIDTKQAKVEVFARSSEELLLNQMQGMILSLAELCQFQLEEKGMTLGWPLNTESKIVPMMQEIYKEQNGEELEVIAVHAGLECGTFYQKNKNLDMISLGADLADVHTPKETLQVDSIETTLNLVTEFLEKIKE